MKKSLLAILITLVVILAGCVNTKSDVADKGNDNKDVKTDDSAVAIELLGMSTGEADMNIVRDQLIKNGFDVKLNIQPDYGSFTAQKDAGNYDLALSSWTTVTGNPDYAVRSLFKSDGDNSIMSDEEVDKLIEQASTETEEEFTKTYKQLEQRLVL